MAVRREEIVVQADVSNAVTRFAMLGKSARGLASDLDAADTRLSNLVQTGMAVAPALVPMATAAIPVMAGLTTQLGFATAGAGVAVLAFQGLGDSVKALNEYALEPTPENLDKVQQAMDRLSPAAQRFALFIQENRDQFDRLQDAAQEGLFPGVEQGLESLMGRLPEFESIISEIASTTGDLVARAGDELASDEWEDFFAYIETNARPMLTDFTETLGHLTKGVAELWMAVDPMSQSFSRGFLDMARDFDTWASNLQGSEGLESFLDYVDEVGPKAADALGAIASAVLDLLRAAAPVGSVALPMIEALADSLAAVARSDAGPVLVGLAAGLSAVSRAVALYRAANGSAMGALFNTIATRPRTAAAGLKADAAALVDFGSGLDSWGKKAGPVVTTNERLRRSFGRLAMGGASVGLFAAAMTDADDAMGLSNTTMLTLMGTMAGPWGAAAGAAVGLTMDIAAANNEFSDALERANDGLRDAPTAFEDRARDLQRLREEQDAFRDSVYAPMSGESWMERLQNSWSPASWQNMIEDVFGTSEAEEQARAVAEAERELQGYKDAVNGVAQAIAGADWAGPTNDMDELTRIAQTAQPAVDALGYSWEQLANANPIGFQIAAASIRAWIAEQDSVEGRTRNVAKAINDLDNDLLSTADSADQLAAALEALLGPELSAEEATDAWVESLRALRSELKDVANPFGQGLQEENMSSAMLANRALTRDTLAATSEMLSAQAKAGASSQDLARQLRTARREFIAEGVAAGISAKQMRERANAIGLTPRLIRTVFQTIAKQATQEARDLVKQYGLTPKQIRTLVTQVNMGASQKEQRELLRSYGLTPKQISTLLRAIDNATPVINGTRSNLRSLDGDRAQVTITTVRETINKVVNKVSRIPEDIFNADGSVMDFYAAGGVRPRIGDQQPQIRPWSGPRGITWSEEGSGPWEAFISGHPAKSHRSRSIADEVVARLGGRTVWQLADGGVLERAYAATGRAGLTAAGVPAFPSSLLLRGTLMTPWGPAEIESIAHAAAVSVVDDYAAGQKSRAGAMYP